MTVYLVISLLTTPYKHRIYVGLAQTVYGISVYVYICRINRIYIYTYFPYKLYIFRRYEISTFSNFDFRGVIL